MTWTTEKVPNYPSIRVASLVHDDVRYSLSQSKKGDDVRMSVYVTGDRLTEMMKDPDKHHWSSDLGWAAGMTEAKKLIEMIIEGTDHLPPAKEMLTKAGFTVTYPDHATLDMMSRDCGKGRYSSWDASFQENWCSMRYSGSAPRTYPINSIGEFPEYLGVDYTKISIAHGLWAIGEREKRERTRLFTPLD